MREVTSAETIRAFMQALGSRVRQPARVYFTGGVTAVMQGWRPTTIDIDIRFAPENDDLYRALPDLKEKLHINIELASPPDFIPPLSGWEDRSIYIGREGRLDFYHFDPYSQALAKIERGHMQDKADVTSMFRDGLIEPAKLQRFYEEIKPELYRYPAISVKDFSTAVQKAVDQEL
jgi:hypothetical protein